VLSVMPARPIAPPSLAKRRVTPGKRENKARWIG
jgi:hypothetical protein